MSLLTTSTNIVYKCILKLYQYHISDAAGKRILLKIKKLYNSADINFTHSRHFLSFVENKIKDISKDSANIYVHIKEIYDELNAFRCKGQKQLSANAKNLTGINIYMNKELHSDISKEEKSEKSLTTAKNVADVFNYKHSNSDEIGHSSKLTQNLQNEPHVKRLEYLLQKIHHKIKRLQQRELNLDDLDNEESSYIQEERFKKRFIKVWKKLCSMTGRSTETGRQVEKRFCYNGCRYPEINRKIEKFINKRKIFPDYIDILKLVSSVNSSLQLPDTQVQSLAREIFEDVGRVLQKRRHQDNKELMGCFLTDSLDFSNDPAEHDEYLKSTLEESFKIGNRKLEELLDSFAQKQIDDKLKPEAIQGDPDKSPPCQDQDDADEDDIEQEETSDIEFIEETLKSDGENDGTINNESLNESLVDRRTLSDSSEVRSKEENINNQACETLHDLSIDAQIFPTSSLSNYKRVSESDIVNSPKKQCLNSEKVIKISLLQKTSIVEEIITLE